MAPPDPYQAQAQRLATAGWCIIPDAIDNSLLDRLCSQLDRSLEIREQIRRRNHVDGSNDGTLHHLLADDPCFVDLLASLARFDPLLRWYFAGNYVLNSYGGVINRRDTNAYVHGVHRDIRFGSDIKRFMINVLVMLDDFTLANGATHLLSGSQTQADRPNPDTFLREADRAVSARGSVLFFNSLLWHATGRSEVDAPRRALTLTLTNPFFKPQLDYPRLLGYDRAAEFNPFLRQVIGYNSRIPASLDEYYRPVSERFYQRGQDD
jgi:Phytanoyl-CoA dioxygenase (PhyH)